MSTTTPPAAPGLTAIEAAASADDAAEGASVREAELATRWTRLQAAAATSRGWRHAVNEDCHSALDSRAPLFVVADGVGGGAFASTASRELVTRLHASLDVAGADPETVRAALHEADRAIGQSIATRTDACGAATVALCKGKGKALSRWLVAWVGDCRVYRLSHADDGAAQLLTVDDSYRQLREAPPHGGSLDDPARMVGNGAIGIPNIREVRLRAGDMLVLCSDGVHKHAAAADIGRLLRDRTPLARRCLRLIDFARECGSGDDATVLVVRRVERDSVRLARRAVGATLVALLVGALAWLAMDSTVERQAAPVRVDSPQAGGST